MPVNKKSMATGKLPRQTDANFQAWSEGMPATANKAGLTKGKGKGLAKAKKADTKTQVKNLRELVSEYPDLANKSGKLKKPRGIGVTNQTPAAKRIDKAAVTDKLGASRKKTK